MDQRGFARATDAGDTAEQVEGDFDVYAAKVVDARAGKLRTLAARLAAVVGTGMVRRPERYLPVMERGCR